MPDCPTPGQCPHEGAIAAMRQQDAAVARWEALPKGEVIEFKRRA